MNVNSSVLQHYGLHETLYYHFCTDLTYNFKWLVIREQTNLMASGIQSALVWKNYDAQVSPFPLQTCFADRTRSIPATGMEHQVWISHLWTTSRKEGIASVVGEIVHIKFRCYGKKGFLSKLRSQVQCSLGKYFIAWFFLFSQSKACDVNIATIANFG